MYKLGILFLAILAVAHAKPAVVAAAYSGVPVAAPFAAPVAYTAPFVTATSAQYVARNYNGVVSAPYVAAANPFVASAAYSYAPAFVY